jgi:hypothetical protein
MRMIQNSKRRIVSILAVSAVVAGGLAAGAAYGGSFSTESGKPTNADGVVARHTPAYPKNAAGQTYGSAADAASPDEEPDLILVMAADGSTGYVLKADLDRIGLSSATNAQQGATWNKDLAARKASGKGISAPMYQVDGKTVVGQFTLAASTGSAATG